MIRLAIVLALFAAPACAASCAPRVQVVERLTSQYGENVVGLGLSSAGVMELFANEDSGSWTVVLTTPVGITCHVGSGEGYERIDPVEIKSGDKL